MKAGSQSKQLKSNNFPTIFNFLYLFSVDVATEFNCLLGYFSAPSTKSTDVCSTKACVSFVMRIIYDVSVKGKMCCWIETVQTRMPKYDSNREFSESVFQFSSILALNLFWVFSY